MDVKLRYMKSSRQRFREFRSKVRSGLLRGDRLQEPAPPHSQPSPAVVHGDGPPPGPPPPHDFKFTKWHLLGQYRLMLRGYYGAVAVLIAVVLVSALAALISPFILKLLIDDVFRNRPLPLGPWVPIASLRLWLTSSVWHDLVFLTLVLAAAVVVSVAASWVRMLAVQRLNYRLAATLRQRLHEHLATLPLGQLADYRTGGIISRIMSDTDQVVGGIQNAIVNPTSALFRVGCVLLILIATSWKLFLIAAALIPPALVIHWIIFRRLRPLWRNIRDDRSMLSARVNDLFAGIQVVRGFRRERSTHAEFAARQHTMVRKQYYTSVLGRLLMTGWQIFVPSMGIVIIWFGGRLVLEHRLSVGDLVMFQVYSMMLLSPLSQMIDSLQELQQNLGALDRVCDVLNQPADMPDRPGAREPPQAGDLELHDVSFGYRPGQTVLITINLRVPAGSTLAIVGPSGSGKSTLVNLIARFYDVRQGSIRLDGVDIREMRLQDYRRLFAAVLQDVYLFDGTVKENIAFGRRGASEDAIVAAAKQANAHEFIMALPQGYDTPIGERGASLSGGEKQRLSIARAMVADPRFLILDEATSSLDTRSERLIQRALEDLMHGRTTIVIAHRLSTVIQADCIAVLVGGRIVEQGTHAELLEAHGIYYVMFTQQFQQHRDPMLERLQWEPIGGGAARS